ncbi:ribose-5-phosphate isomerase RpiA [Psittacicella hinzii]|uniref:Ribose-5-phosphate isomerase A n=1 Tax=Psittacicella hinzii TaxID=2028575 RepID=A0A3A1YFZ1_9GAMM|nr:ribose-5-phosphate isomerase RpiA [Psittacicella hinzii]RIY35144.1 ribose 5-phosphate isomerase A [Psittacicella hinzii]
MKQHLNNNEQKLAAAKKALALVQENKVIGIGSGSTVNVFISLLAELPFKIKGAVAASVESERRLKEIGIRVFTPKEVGSLDIYFDGADEVTPEGYMTKGGGAALTREKILAALSNEFICMVDQSKLVQYLGTTFALPLEVIPLAESLVLNKLEQLGGKPKVREGVITDNGNIIIDVKDFVIEDPLALEAQLNNIPGIVTNGIFAFNKASQIIVGDK